jgi:hypothetical protein
MTLTYDDYQIDEATIPAHNVQWMLQSTLRRLMGNQVDAALSARIKGQANGQDPEAFRTANEAAVARKRDELTASKAPATQATSSRIAGRHHFGIGGRHGRNPHHMRSYGSRAGRNK